MANFAYVHIKERMLTGGFNWLTDNVVALLVARRRYTPSVHHRSLLDIPADARVAMSDVLTGRTVTDNVLDADDYQFAGVSGPPVGAVVLLVNSGVPDTSWLICHLDQSVAGLPLTPNGGAVHLTWDNGPARIFAL